MIFYGFCSLHRRISFYVFLMATTFSSNILLYSYSPFPCFARISVAGLTTPQSAHFSHERKESTAQKFNSITLSNLILDLVPVFVFKYLLKSYRERKKYSIFILSVQKIYGSQIKKRLWGEEGGSYIWHDESEWRWRGKYSTAIGRSKILLHTLKTSSTYSNV